MLSNAIASNPYTPPLFSKTSIAVGTAIGTFLVVIGTVLEVIAILGYLHMIPGINAIVAGSLAGLGVLVILTPLAVVGYLLRQSSSNQTNKKSLTDKPVIPANPPVIPVKNEDKPLSTKENDEKSLRKENLHSTDSQTEKRSTEITEGAFPKNVIQSIFKLADAKDLANCRLVCKKWNNAFEAYAPFRVKNISGQYASKAESALGKTYRAVGPNYRDIDYWHLATCHSGVALKRLAGKKGSFDVEERRLSLACHERGNLRTIHIEALEAALLIANTAGDPLSFKAAKKYAQEITDLSPARQIDKRDRAYYRIARLEAKFNSANALQTTMLIQHEVVRKLAQYIINNTVPKEVKTLVDMIHNHTRDRPQATSYIVSDIVKKWALDGQLQEAKDLAGQLKKLEVYPLTPLENHPFLCAIACIDPKHDFNEVRKLCSNLDNRSRVYIDTVHALFDLEGAKQEARTNGNDYYLALSLYNIACIEGKRDFSEALAATIKIEREDLRERLLFCIALNLVYSGQKDTSDFKLVVDTLASFRFSSSITYSRYVNALKQYSDTTKKSKVEIRDELLLENVTFQLDQLRPTTYISERKFVRELSDTAQKLFACGRIEEGAKIMQGLTKLNMHPATRANILLDMRDAIEESGEAEIKIG